MSDNEIRRRKTPEEGSASAPNRVAKGSLKEEAIRTRKMLEALNEKAPPALVPYLKKLAPVGAAIIIGIELSLPIMAQIVTKVNWFLSVCPLDLLYAITGILLCFFGGMYPTTIAAWEAWSQLGGHKAIGYVKELALEFKKVNEKSSADDLVDADNDGIADVNQMSGVDLLKRKTQLALATVDPNKLNDALGGLYSGWIGVMGVLKIQFAKTIALGCSIGTFLQKPAEAVLTPALSYFVEEQYRQWIPAVIGWTTKYIGVQVAWYIQKVISAFHSAIRGGLMFSRGILKYANDKGYIKFNDEESYLDEILGWSLAAVGFYFQFKMGFKLPFPFNLLLWPLGMIEFYIQWTLTS